MSHEGSASRAEAVPLAQPESPEEVITAASGPAAAPESWISVEVKPGQTLSQIFDAHGLAPTEWMQILELGGDTGRLVRLKAGDRLQLSKNETRLRELVFTLDELRTLQIRRTDLGFESETIAAEIERRPTYGVGVITSSPWNACQEAGLTPNLCVEMSEIFGYDIDFSRDIRVGDRFSVIYEDLYKDGERVREGNILAAEFVNQGRNIRAVRYADATGRAGFYTPEGKSLHREFRRNPLDIIRITSNFSSGRRHPVLNRIRAHRGVDYGAGTGTPIRATADGRIAFRGVKGGYGRTIILRHGRGIETLYAHMSRFRNGLVTGSRVRQGQTIGYVGSSGLATGPHLHYEFRINGVHKDPRKVHLPRAESLARQYLDHYRASSQPLLAQLDALDRSRVAQAH